MAKTVEISMDSIKGYFSGLTSFQQLAWGAIGLGVVLIIVAIVVW
jgi:hypothetical protein